MNFQHVIFWTAATANWNSNMMWQILTWLWNKQTATTKLIIIRICVKTLHRRSNSRSFYIQTIALTYFLMHCLFNLILFLKNVFFVWKYGQQSVPVELIVHTATGVMHASQSRGVNKLLLQTAPLLFTQISQDNGSELGYAEDEHSNSVIWWTNGFFVWLKFGRSME